MNSANNLSPARSRGGLAAAASLVANTAARNAKKRSSYYESPAKCAHCSAVIPFEQKRHRFCNHSCAATYINKNVHGRSDAHPRWGTRVICICGKETSSYVSTYCSIKCSARAKYLRFIESWRAGDISTKNGYNPSQLKRYLIEKHGAKCFKCGWGEVNQHTGKAPVQMHHVDGNAGNISEENLELVCPNCHSLTGNFGGLNRGNGRSYRYAKKIL